MNNILEKVKSRLRRGLEIHKLELEAPDATSTTAVHAAITLLSTSQDILTNITNPDFPRVLTITGAMAGASLTGNVAIYGKDIQGNNISDTIALNNNSTVAGVKAFKSVWKIHVPARTTASDTVSIGFNDAFGLEECVPANTVLTATADGVRDATFPTVTFNATDVSRNTVDPNTAANADKDFAFYYIA